MRHVSIRRTGLALLLVLAAAPALSAQTTTYEFRSIATPGSGSAFGAGIDNQGTVVGWYLDAAGAKHGFIDQAGTVSTVDRPGAAHTSLYGINDAGLVPGSTFTAAQTSAFDWQQGTFTNVAFPGTSGRAQDVNSFGDEAGAYNDVLTRTRGVIRIGGNPVGIDYPGAFHTGPCGINDAGTVVGWYMLPGSAVPHGFVYSGGAFTTLDYPGALGTSLSDIDNQGRIAGFLFTAGLQSQAAILHDGTSFTQLQIPGATGSTWAEGINEWGDVCGTYESGARSLAFVLTARTCQADAGGASPGGATLGLCGRPLRTGGFADLRLAGAPAFAPFWVAAGPGAGPVPYAGGTVFAVPWILVFPAQADASGSWILPGVPGGGGPFSLHVQALHADSQTAGGWALTNAIQAAFLP